MLDIRRHRRLRIEDIGRLCRSVGKIRPFVIADGWTPRGLVDEENLRARIAPRPKQLSLL
jgi:predicted DNA-binding helix-hairpin-helix protein